MSVINIESFDVFKQLIQEKPIVVVDFFATWCKPCMKLKPDFEKLAETEAKYAAFIEVDIDKADEIVATYDVSSAPTFLIFVKGKIVDIIKGADLKKVIEKLNVHRLC